MSNINAFREYLAGLIGAEIQVHDITFNGKTQKVTFRQISDAEGRDIFKPGQDGETDEARGERVMAGLIAASMCDDAGQPIGTEAEARALPQVVRLALYEKAAITNNMALPAAAAESEAPAEGAAPSKS